MSGRNPKKNQKLASSRRYKNRNRDTEEKENDGFPDPENEDHGSEQSHSVPESQASNESSVLLSDQPVVAYTNPNTSDIEQSLHPQSQDPLAQPEVTSKKRKMGSTRKPRNIKFEGIHEDEPEHMIQISEGVRDEQGWTPESSIKEDGGKDDQKCILDCAGNNESSILQEQHLAIMLSEEHQNSEKVIQNKPIDNSFSELNQSLKTEFGQDLLHTSLDFSIVPPAECNVPLQESDESLHICHQMDTFSEPVVSLPNTTDQTSMINISYTPLNENREESLDVQTSMTEHTVLKTIEDQSSLDFIIIEKQEDKQEREDVDIPNNCSAEDIGQNEVPELQSASVIKEHEHGTQDDKASKEDENVVDLEHMDDTLKLITESIGKFKSTELREDMDENKEVSDPELIKEPESTAISQPVSEKRPGIDEVTTTTVDDTNVSTEAGLVSLDDMEKSLLFVVSTGGKPKIDFEQWNEQLPEFEEVVYNIVMVGNSSVGKTSFIKRLQNGQFIPDYSATIGVDTFVQTIQFGNRTVKLYVWDTAGQERYHSITKQVFNKAQGLLLMYDITSSQSFHAIRSWISQVQEKAPPETILMLLGNKNDCALREVQLQEGENLAKEYDIHFMECSAATGENVLDSMKTLAWLLVKQRVRKVDEYTTLQQKPQNKKSGCC